jgi:hypothetical protein
LDASEKGWMGNVFVHESLGLCFSICLDAMDNQCFHNTTPQEC